MNTLIILFGDFAVAFRRLLPYMAYNLVLLLAYLFVISIFSFFHFILGHEFNLIEIFVQENIWMVLTISKLIGFFIIYQYYKIQSFKHSLTWAYLTKSFELPSRSFYVVLTFLFLFFVIQLRPELNEKWSFVDVVGHFVGHSVYFFTDFLVVSYLIKVDRPKTKGDTTLTLSLASLFFGVLSYVIVPSGENFSFFFVFGFFLMLFFYIRKEGWGASVWVLLFFNNVLNVFFGQDIFVEENIGLFHCERGLGWPEISLAFILCLIYLKFRYFSWSHPHIN
ncbi:MAG: hypothetical protein OXB88_01570 [Bacteriovoracales bacterium]|nr:hypothetical protein [Bacteriovoracales bacterium]